MSAAKQNILVTGAQGYIGAHISKALHRNGYSVFSYDDGSTGKNDITQWATSLKGSIADLASLNTALDQAQADLVIHLAAKTSVPESIEEPEFYIEQNYTGTQTLLTALKERKIHRLVFSSTAAVYGSTEECPVNETSKTAPLNPYGASKLYAEQAIMDAGKSFGLNYYIMRYFNAVGCDPESEIGFPMDSASLIPSLLRSIINKTPFTLYGSDYPTKDGTAIRDLIHVQDLANAHIRAAKDLLETPQPIHHTLNLGTGRGYSLLEIIEATEAITKCKVDIQYEDRRPGDSAESIADTKKALDILNWKAQYNDIHHAIQDCWSWLNTQQTKP